MFGTKWSLRNTNRRLKQEFSEGHTAQRQQQKTTTCLIKPTTSPEKQTKVTAALPDSTNQSQTPSVHQSHSRSVRPAIDMYSSSWASRRLLLRDMYSSSWASRRLLDADMYWSSWASSCFFVGTSALIWTRPLEAAAPSLCRCVRPAGQTGR